MIGQPPSNTDVLIAIKKQLGYSGDALLESTFRMEDVRVSISVENLSVADRLRKQGTHRVYLKVGSDRGTYFSWSSPSAAARVADGIRKRVDMNKATREREHARLTDYCAMSRRMETINATATKLRGGLAPRFAYDPDGHLRTRRAHLDLSQLTDEQRTALLCDLEEVLAKHLGR